MELDEYEIAIGACLNLLDKAAAEDTSEKLKEKCLRHLVLSLRLLADMLSMELDMET